MKRSCLSVFLILTITFVFLCGCSDDSNVFEGFNIPDFSGEAYIVVNDNKPLFSEQDIVAESFETYSELDKFGRCGAAMACIGIDIMPTEEREGIGQIKPSGWHTVKYDIVDGKYLYNRCHLIGYQLTGENANEKNLITGTRYLNIEGMLPFENMVADYIKETKNHVMYRVTPVFEGDNLVASGVCLEAISVEDDGEGICFNVYAYNNQPGVSIDYLTGESVLDKSSALTESKPVVEDSEENTYVLNTNSKKFHNRNCSSVDDIESVNREDSFKLRKELIDDGYLPCKICNP